MKINPGLEAEATRGRTTGSGDVKLIEVVPVDPRSPVAAGLLRRLQHEVSPETGSYRRTAVEAPGGPGFTVFVLARNPENPAVYYGCGGLRYLGGNTGEIRNMYVVPEQRGALPADRILAWLENHARSRNWATLRLETRATSTRAISFYEGHGYSPTPRYGPYTASSHSLCFEKTIRPHL